MRTISAKKATTGSDAASASIMNATSDPKKIAPITVTISGDLAEKMRAEATASGLMPLSLVKQRLRLGSLLTDNTAEAKEFRMDVAEKTFREAGRYLVPQSFDPADPPAGCIMARVTPNDAGTIRCWASKSDSPVWIVAGVFVALGNETIGSSKAAEAIKSNPTNCLWRCIYRKEERFTETIPVFVGDALEHVAETASAMRRDLGDWLGVLIELGAAVVSSKGNLDFMTGGNEFELLAKSAELESIKQALAGGEGGEA